MYESRLKEAVEFGCLMMSFCSRSIPLSLRFSLNSSGHFKACAKGDRASGSGGALYVVGVVILIACGVSLRVPYLEAGAASDDYMQYAILDGRYPSPRAPLDLFNFAAGTPDDNAPLMRYGTLPWWTAPELRLSMLRPLSAALVWVDVTLFPDTPMARHAHSFLWWALMVGLVACLLAQCLPPLVAWMGVGLFVLEEGHNLPIGWLAHRGAIVAMCFGLAGLLLHTRARRRGERMTFVLGLMAFAVALASGEWTFPVFGYLIAYELLEAPGSLSTRIRWLVPAGLLASVFLVVRGVLGYGARGSGMYIDPVADPGLFVRESLQRIPVFFADLLYSVPSDRFSFGTPWRDWILRLELIPPDVWMSLPGYRFWHVLLGLTAVGVFGLSVRWIASLVEPALWRQVRWLLVGGLISLLPVLASFPTSRLLVPISIGLSALIATGVHVAAARLLARVRGLASGSPRDMWVAAVFLLFVGHFQVVETIRSDLDEVGFTTALYSSVRTWWRTADIDDASLSQKRLIIASTMEHTTAMFGPFVLRELGRPMPRSSWVLNGSRNPHDLWRVGPRDLELWLLGGTMMVNGMELLYRDPRLPMHVGHEVDLEGMRIRVLAAEDGKPTRLRFSFDKPLEDPEYVFLETTRGGLRRFRPPEPGRYRRFPRPAFPDRADLDRHARLWDPHALCFGQRPNLSSCRVGFGSADCGGVGEPSFACNPFGDCRWFEHGCAAIGYLPSTCTADAICCHLGGTWPFELEDTRGGAIARAARRTLQAFGTRGWEFWTHRILPLRIDSRLRPTTPAVSCSGVSGGACGLPTLDELGAFDASVAFSLSPPGYGWSLTVEGARTPAGELVARVCRVAPVAPEAEACDPAPPPACAVDGEVTLREVPIFGPAQRTMPAGHLWARFADGALVDASF